jgi:hypothetical protein
MRHISACLGVVFFLGCSATELVKPEQLTPGAWQNIMIVTTDGRIIRMLAENHSIVRSGDTSYVQGTGLELLKTEEYETKPFAGRIPFSEIKLIETTERSFLYRTLPIMLGMVAVFFLLILTRDIVPS